MKYTRKFNDLSAANAAGSVGLDSPHIDVVSGLTGRTSVLVYILTNRRLNFFIIFNPRLKNFNQHKSQHEFSSALVD